MGDHQFGSFTQGIIDLLINTTGEFVTERLTVDTVEINRKIWNNKAKCRTDGMDWLSYTAVTPRASLQSDAKNKKVKSKRLVKCL